MRATKVNRLHYLAMRYNQRIHSGSEESMILTRKEKIQPSQSTQQTLWAISDLCNTTGCSVIHYREDVTGK
jgi:hypothetical protein